MDISASALMDLCHEHLTGFEVPKMVIFGEWPKTATGKLHKFARHVEVIALPTTSRSM